jgi:beta-1,4-mannooligosaccharide/beta-1,4-mannosyl-N-acetylglucosamine phosphorylase
MPTIFTIFKAMTDKIKFPWEERPQGSSDVIWRYSGNPIIGRYDIPSSNSIFNSAVVPFGEAYAGVFRCDNKAVQMNIHAGFSKDGINWEIDHQPIEMQAGNTQMIESDYKYDPRVTWLEDRYWVSWCNGYHGPTIGLAYTFDFKEFFQCENAFLPFNRNGVLFPERIDGKYAMLSRPSDNGHTPFGDIYISFSPDMLYWGEHRCVMKVSPFERSAWQCTKIGAGSVPIRTDEGWLIFYHGVINTCNGFRYSMGAAILDLEDPSRVRYRTQPYLLAPDAPYELAGDVPNVLFPTAALSQKDQVAIYYGAADTVVGLAFGYLQEILDFVKANSL